MKKRKKRLNKKKKNKRIALVLLMIIPLIIGFLIGYFLSREEIKREETCKITETEFNISSIGELSTEGFVAVEVKVEPQVIYLKAECKQLSMTASLEQTISIQKALDNETTLRPLAHDLFFYTIKNFNISLLLVKIHSLRDETYFASVFLQKGNKILELDARPSDAIAIALRANKEVYVKKELLEQYSQRVC